MTNIIWTAHTSPVADPLDNGEVAGHMSLADNAHLEEVDKKHRE